MTDLSTEGGLRRFLQALPKTETHLHIEGALPLELLRTIRPDFPDPPPAWARDFKYRDWDHFLTDILDLSIAYLTTPDRYYDVASVVFAGHVARNVRYVEVSFASGMIDLHDVSGREILDSIRAAVPDGLEVRIFLGIHHDGAGPKMLPRLEAALGWDGLAGIDLHGTETDPVESWTAPLWRDAREAGKCTKAHAGEFMGADFVLKVLDELRPHRIEHGIRAVESPAVVAELIRRGIPLDICPISNHKLVPGCTLRTHPIRALYHAGVRVTVSTDDPLLFGNNIIDDYAALGTETGFSPAELVQLARNGFEVALVDDAQRQRWQSEIDTVAHSFSIGEKAVG